MNFKSTMHKILNSSLLLRVIFVLSLFNLIGYIVYGNIHAIVFFFLIGGLVRFFSKNIILILGIPLFVVNLFVLGKNNREGMGNSSSSNQNSNSSSNQNSNTNSNQNSQDASNNMMKQAVMNKMSSNSASSGGDQSTSNQNMPTSNDESFEVGRKKGQHSIDYASTIENAYDDLNKIIGGDGIKNLTSDTQNLMQQQLKLAETMKGMGPLIEQMGPLMQSFGPMMEQAKGFMGGSGGSNFASLTKSFTASK
jgi:hypothetical protein